MGADQGLIALDRDSRPRCRRYVLYPVPRIALDCLDCGRNVAPLRKLVETFRKRSLGHFPSAVDGLILD